MVMPIISNLQWKLHEWFGKITSTKKRLSEIENEISMLSNGIFRPKITAKQYKIGERFSWDIPGVTDCSGCGCLIRRAVAIRDNDDFYCKRCREEVEP